MIEHAIALLEMEDLPSWEKDAPLRREMENLRDDVKAYQVASSYDTGKAARKAAQIQERADRIRSFLKGSRHGGRPGGTQSLNSRHRYE